ncbi:MULTISPECIES: hypothetical protein [Dysgonomonas]|uniref:tRNA nuclease CdiA C-terminal domain-containing protein n=1 Tax=Dysgonomonas gadei ATCC BAA-286 TaxID=742766 RepID=F5J0M8_9BACT|nr:MULTISPECIES: hypothetical protein [Dysgonomonas]EGK00621.1 hypothetical protein HMPREF9455_02895 [Dysgonomonas gadei ATCC BAA-286]MBF0651955.1 hypothetical protein [Dysgonomonas sp. GY75]
MEDIKCECSELISYPLIVLEEQKSKIVFENKNRIEINKITVDGCQITDERPRCDYLLIKVDENTEYFVELKGHDINRALEQIEATIPRLSKDMRQQKKYCFIISVRTPMSSTQIQNIAKSYKKKYNAELIMKSSPGSHTL